MLAQVTAKNVWDHGLDPRLYTIQRRMLAIKDN